MSGTDEAEAAVYLPHDLMIELLSWLPAKTLLCWRSVCKTWYSTIADPEFIDKHRQRAVADNGLIVIPKETMCGNPWPLRNVKFLMLPEGKPHGGTLCLDREPRYCRRVVGTCNGIICHKSFSKDPERLFLCNPGIRWATQLPVCPLLNKSGSHSGYDEGSCDFCYGIGYDETNKDYKIVQTCPLYAGKTAVFSMKSMWWKIIEEGEISKELIYSGASVFLHGCIHWLTHQAIVVFNVHNEKFEEMQLPEILMYNNKYTLYVSGGCLCVLIPYREFYEGCDLVWTMKVYGDVNSWTSFKVSLDPRIERCIAPTFGGKILLHSTKRVTMDGKLVDEDGWKIVRPAQLQLILYDPLTDKYTNVCRAKGYLPDHFLFLEGTLEFLSDNIRERSFRKRKKWEI